MGSLTLKIQGSYIRVFTVLTISDAAMLSLSGSQTGYFEKVFALFFIPLIYLVVNE